MLLQVGRRPCHPPTLLRHLQAASQVLCQARNHTHTYRESYTDHQEGTVSHLRNDTNGAQLYLVGTAHVSAKSAEEVRQVINRVKPDVVAVELCEERAKTLMSNKPGDHRVKTPFQQLQDLLGLPGGLGEKLLGFWLKSMYDLLRNTGVEPGKEFKVAMEEAMHLNSKIIYIDRNVHETVKRLRGALSFWDVIKIIRRSDDPFKSPPPLMEEPFHELETAVERLKTRQNVRELMAWMEADFPDVVRVMVHERDELMVKHLRGCKGTVVGVVGMAHMDGIERLWKEAQNLYWAENEQHGGGCCYLLQIQAYQMRGISSASKCKMEPKYHDMVICKAKNKTLVWEIQLYKLIKRAVFSNMSSTEWSS